CGREPWAAIAASGLYDNW
nr:immunoglobulin heavy chain junction region [Macaca mulatta]